MNSYIIICYYFNNIVYNSGSALPCLCWRKRRTSLLTQLHKYQLNLLHSQIYLNQFNSHKPHLFTIFMMNDHNWYIDVFTHASGYGNVNNHLLHKTKDFIKKPYPQYFARFQLNSGNLPKIWDWSKFKTIHDTNQLKYFNTYYKNKRIYNKQFIYTRTGIIFRDYNIKNNFMLSK